MTDHLLVHLLSRTIFLLALVLSPCNECNRQKRNRERVKDARVNYFSEYNFLILHLSYR